MFGFIKKLFGNKYERDIKTVMPQVDSIKEEYALLESVSNDELRNKTIEFRATIAAFLKEIDQEIDGLKKQVEAIDDIDQKQDIFTEIDKLGKERDEDIEQVLKDILPQAFAVVKETARRFSENEVPF